MPVTGVCTIRINGTLMKSKKGAKLTFGGANYMPQIANGVVVGHANDPEPCEVEATFVHDSTMGVDAMNALLNLVEGQGMFETDTGHTYSIDNIARASGMVLTSGEGELTYKFTGAFAVPLS